MLDRYRQPAPAAPEALAPAGAKKTATGRAAPAAPAAPAENSTARTDAVLEDFAAANGTGWPAARSQMIEGDMEAGADQLAADNGDGAEHACVALWLRLLAERAPATAEAWPKGYRTAGTGLDAYGLPLPPTRAAVTCETCRHFQPDPINPPAGVGTCAAGVGHLSIGTSLYPMAPRYCDGHEVAA